jgi:hypothetical protein
MYVTCPNCFEPAKADIPFCRKCFNPLSEEIIEKFKLISPESFLRGYNSAKEAIEYFDRKESDQIIETIDSMINESYETIKSNPLYSQISDDPLFSELIDQSEIMANMMADFLIEKGELSESDRNEFNQFYLKFMMKNLQDEELKESMLDPDKVFLVAMLAVNEFVIDRAERIASIKKHLVDSGIDASLIQKRFDAAGITAETGNRRSFKESDNWWEKFCGLVFVGFIIYLILS